MANYTSAFSRGFLGLRKAKPASRDLAVEYSKGLGSVTPGWPPRSTDAGGGTTSGTLLRVWLKSPWEDYTSIFPRSTTGGSKLAYRKGAYFNKAAIRVFRGHGSIQALQQLSDVQHPNIAKICDVYCFDDKLYIAAEYLEISLTDLDFQAFQLEEWEIATVIAEVLKGSAYLLFRRISCKDLSMSNIRLSTYGDVKIVLDLEQYEQEHLDEDPSLSHAILDLPFLAEMVEDMMLPRYHLTGNDSAWSRDALEFLSWSLSGSVDNLLRHPFLALATPTSRLAPRIRFTIEVLRLKAGRTDGS